MLPDDAARTRCHDLCTPQPAPRREFEEDLGLPVWQ
jgi:hypothetical protein